MAAGHSVCPLGLSIHTSLPNTKTSCKPPLPSDGRKLGVHEHLRNSAMEHVEEVMALRRLLSEAENRAAFATRRLEEESARWTTHEREWKDDLASARAELEQWRARAMTAERRVEELEEREIMLLEEQSEQLRQVETLRDASDALERKERVVHLLQEWSLQRLSDSATSTSCGATPCREVHVDLASDDGSTDSDAGCVASNAGQGEDEVWDKDWSKFGIAAAESSDVGICSDADRSAGSVHTGVRDEDYA
eukprot:CAMPEP_0117545180 /NCGR_PEP_ID=MMETSP0784-20121206/45962_1 /TAXON_ID=39447 /ORGANISM="" /LENGTH=249 /DNA_ID=CAMNT_0005342019 /DNA_START=65 /DNA_END=811 /DNA_ORIENTATION=-